jgi:hypothetical protein
MLHREILNQEQVSLLPLVKSFAQDFGLVGGTAIALHLGHRQSIDFDLFTNKKFENLKIRKKIFRFKKIKKILKDEAGQYTLVVRGVGLTFFSYPFKINFSRNFNQIIKLPDLLTLAAMKAHALGRRAKWKDYVDLYFIMKKYNGPREIIKRARQIFRSEFNEKIFRAQLAYFKDLDYSEKIIYRPGFKVSDKKIKQALIDFSLKFNF